MASRNPVDLPDAERVAFFTDAVVAIAMTMLVLPLMEAVNEEHSQPLTTLDFVREHSRQLYVFVLSFVVIASFWLSHHRLWQHVRRVDAVTRWLNVAWQLCVVWLPVGTAMVGSRLEKDAAQYLLYIGPQLVSMLALTLLVRHLQRHPELLDAPESVQYLHGPLSSGVIVALYAAALLLALFAPGVGYFAMYLLLLIWPASVLLKRHSRVTPASG